MSQPVNNPLKIRQWRVSLWIGEFQAGKTLSAIKESFSRQDDNPNIVSVFVAYGTNINKENQERHIHTVYGKNLSLISTREDIKAFKLRAQKNELDFYRKPIVISALGHWATLELLQNILTTKSRFRYHLWLDESDSYSKDFDKQEIHARKDNLIDSISYLEYHQVDEIICITATPFTELVSKTNFDSVKEIEPAEGYISINNILNESVKSLQTEDIMAFNEGRYTPELEEYFIEDAEKRNTVTIVSTISSMPVHKLQAQTLSEVIADPGVIVVEFNSNDGEKYWNFKENPFVSKKKNRKDQLKEMFEVAENYEKLIVVGYGMLDRSVTLKNDKFSSFSSMLFSGAKDSALPAFLQRVARICGYQDYLPELWTDKASELYLAGWDFPALVKVTKDNKNAVDRRKALLSIEELNYGNPFGHYRTNAVRIKTSSNTPQDEVDTKQEAKALGFDVINEVKRYSKEKLDDEIVLQLVAKIKATSGTALYKKIMEDFKFADKILNVEGANREDYSPMQLPNQSDPTENYRNTLYYWNGNTLTVSNQPYLKVRGKYAIEHIKTGCYRCYNAQGKFRFLDKSER